MKFSATDDAEGAVPVTITEVMFEGNFISVKAITDTGLAVTSELRNDGSVTIPDVGTRMHVSFDAARAAILPDSSTAGN